MYTIRKQWHVEMAHRLTEAHTKACSDCIHGHTYTIELFLEAEDLDSTGMVIDFGALGEIKALVMRFDHALMLESRPENQHEMISNKNIMWVDFNPTAENMARELYERIAMSSPIKGQQRIRLAKVRVHETASGFAEFQKS